MFDKKAPSQRKFLILHKKNFNLKNTFGTTRGHIFLLALGTWGARRPNLAQLLEYYTMLPLFSDQVYITDWSYSKLSHFLEDHTVCASYRQHSRPDILPETLVVQNLQERGRWGFWYFPADKIGHLWLPFHGYSHSAHYFQVNYRIQQQDLIRDKIFLIIFKKKLYENQD